MVNTIFNHDNNGSSLMQVKDSHPSSIDFTKIEGGVRKWLGGD